MTLSTSPPRIGHLRFLTLLLSYLPTGPAYTADAGKWAEALQWLRDEYEEEYPHLFSDLSFLDRPDLPPHSLEVSEFLTQIQFGDVVEVMNPTYTRLRIRDDAQQRVRSEHEKRVDATTLSTIQKLARELLARQQHTLVVSA